MYRVILFGQIGTRNFGGVIRVYNIYLLIFKRHITLYIEMHYGNV